MDDLISRQAAIDALHTWFRDGFDEDKWWNSTRVLAAIEGLHPVQQEHKWETCFECPLSHGCPKIKGCTNEQAIEYASQIPNDCPLSAQPNLQPTCNQLATDCISRQQAIDALNVLCQEHRYKIPGKRETYGQYNEAWQDALDRAEGAIFNLPPAQPEPQWIPVSERLPESGTYCLFTVFEHDSELEATTIETVYGRFDDYGERRYWSWEDEVGKCCIEGEEQLDGYHGEIIEQVIAWMPLPTPYQKGVTP